MLTSRGQENIVHARPAAGKALLPKTPSNFQTPRATTRAPLGAKTTNAKAHTVFRDGQNDKLQVFKTPAPGQQRILPAPIQNRPSTARRSGRSKITVAPLEIPKADATTYETEEDEPEFGYAPPPIVELPDPPIEFDYDQTFPQFNKDNLLRGYGEIYHGSPKDEDGFSIRLKKEQEEYRRYQEEQEQQLTRRVREELSKPMTLSDDEIEPPMPRLMESRPDTVKARSAASALSSMRLPSVVHKQTASSKLKMVQPIQSKNVLKSGRHETHSRPAPMSVSRNTIGFPKARKAPSIIPEWHSFRDHNEEMDILADDLSDFEFQPLFSDDDDDFQLPVPE